MRSSAALQRVGPTYPVGRPPAQVDQLVACCPGLARGAASAALLGSLFLLWSRPTPRGHLGGNPRGRDPTPACRHRSPTHARDLPRLLRQTGSPGPVSLSSDRAGGLPHIRDHSAGLAIASDVRQRLKRDVQANTGRLFVESRTMAQHIIEAALKPSAAENYPYLPVRMWTQTRRLAELVATHRGIPRAAWDGIDRVLSDRDFMFRSGRRAELH